MGNKKAWEWDSAANLVTGITPSCPHEGCDSETIDRIRVISKDPMAAAQAHGHDTGNCSACGRLLTNELSVEIGIGPICRGRWGI